MHDVIKKCCIFQQKFLVDAKVDYDKIDGFGGPYTSQIKRFKFNRTKENSPLSSPVSSLNNSLADMSSRDFVL